MNNSPRHAEHLRDFTADPRILMLSGLALILGAAGATLAWILLRLIYACTNLFYFQRFSWNFVSPATNQLHWLAVFVPVIGGLIVGLIARYGSDKIRGHGIPEALESILTNGAKVGPRVALFKPLSSAIVIGSGGPFGAEGPIIMTAGSVGSLFAQFFHLTDAERTTLLVAGAAAGMTGIFDTPLAAVLLAVELLLFEWRPRSFVPVAIAAATAGVLRRYFLPVGPLFPMPMNNHPIRPATMLGALFVGIVAGALALILSRAVYASEDLFDNHLPVHWMWWPAIGGGVVGIGGLIFPRALGTGYEVIDSLLSGDQAWQLIAGVLIIKSIIWSFSLGSGTSGGILAPLLMIGAALGALFTPILPAVSSGAWPLVAMTAVLSGSIGCPLTAAVLSLELTHNWGMLLPVFIASVSAHAFTVFYQRRSILTERISRRGHHLSREYSVDPLEVILAEDVMRTRVIVLPDTLTAADAAQWLAKNRNDTPRRSAEVHASSEVPAIGNEEYRLIGDLPLPGDKAQHRPGSRRQRLYPLVDGEGRLTGVMTRHDLAVLAASDSPEQKPAPRNAPVVAHPHETLRTVAERMATSHVLVLPVIEHHTNRLLGLLGTIDILQARARAHDRETRLERLRMPFARRVRKREPAAIDKSA